MEMVEGACRRVLANVDGALLPSLVDLETGLALGITEAASQAPSLAEASDATEVGVAAGVDPGGAQPKRTHWE